MSMLAFELLTSHLNFQISHLNFSWKEKVRDKMVGDEIVMGMIWLVMIWLGMKWPGMKLSRG